MASPVMRNVSSGRIARTELDFESARDDRKRRQAEMDAVRLLIALIDSLFAELEIINLAGCCSGSLLAIKGGRLRQRLQLEDERRGWCEVGD